PRAKAARSGLVGYGRLGLGARPRHLRPTAHGGPVLPSTSTFSRPIHHLGRGGIRVRDRNDVERAQWQLWAVAFVMICGLAGALIFVATGPAPPSRVTFVPSSA